MSSSLIYTFISISFKYLQEKFDFLYLKNYIHTILLLEYLYLKSFFIISPRLHMAASVDRLPSSNINAML